MIPFLPSLHTPVKVYWKIWPFFHSVWHFPLVLLFENSSLFTRAVVCHSSAVLLLGSISTRHLLNHHCGRDITSSTFTPPQHYTLQKTSTNHPTEWTKGPRWGAGDVFFGGGGSQQGYWGPIQDEELSFYLGHPLPPSPNNSPPREPILIRG